MQFVIDREDDLTFDVYGLEWRGNDNDPTHTSGSQKINHK